LSVPLRPRKRHLVACEDLVDGIGAGGAHLLFYKSNLEHTSLTLYTCIHQQFMSRKQGELNPNKEVFLGKHAFPMLRGGTPGPHIIDGAHQAPTSLHHYSGGCGGVRGGGCWWGFLMYWPGFGFGLLPHPLLTPHSLEPPSSCHALTILADSNKYITSIPLALYYTHPLHH
jgi:hypothetical protein